MKSKKAPSFLNAVKKAIDKDRSRRIVLSGSARLMLMRNVSESLAGRAVYEDLMPFSNGELKGNKYSGWIEEFMETGGLPSSFTKGQRVGKSALYSAKGLFRGYLPPLIVIDREDQGCRVVEGVCESIP